VAAGAVVSAVLSTGGVGCRPEVSVDRGSGVVGVESPKGCGRLMSAIEGTCTHRQEWGMRGVRVPQ